MSRHLEKVIAIIAENLGINGDFLDEDSNLVEDCGQDSLDMVDLAMAIEDEYTIDIEDEDVDSWTVIGDICNTVDRKAKDEPDE